MGGVARALTLALVLAPGTALACWTVPVVAVERVINGDTVVLRLSLWIGLETTETVRLLGVETPSVGHPLAATAATRAKAFTEAWLQVNLQKVGLRVWACRRDTDGRILGGILTDGTSLTKALLDAGHGVVDDGRKQPRVNILPDPIPDQEEPAIRPRP
jgi:endonuclease YncB( thermonuclease family)